jgi:CRISPR system Cascade subunit CasE
MFLSYLLIDTAADPARPRPGRAWVRNPYRVHQRLCMAFPSAERRELDNEFVAPFVPADFPTLVRKEETRGGRAHVHHVREEAAGFLFRIDMVAEPIRAADAKAVEWRGRLGSAAPSRHVIVVQSGGETEPRWDYAFHNAREFLCAEPLVKGYSATFKKGQHYRFVLRANPTKKVGTASKAERLAARATNSRPSGRHGRRVYLRDPAEQGKWLREQGEGTTDREGKGFRVLDVCAESESPVRGRKDDHRITLASVRFEGVLEVTDAVTFRAAVFAGIGPGKGLGFGLLSLAPA